MYGYTCVYIYIHIYIYMYMCINVLLKHNEHTTKNKKRGLLGCRPLQPICAYSYSYVYMYTYIYIYICVTYMYTIIYIYIYVYVYMYICNCVHIYIYIMMLKLTHRNSNEKPGLPGRRLLQPGGRRRGARGALRPPGDQRKIPSSDEIWPSRNR